MTLPRAITHAGQKAQRVEFEVNGNTVFDSNLNVHIENTASLGQFSAIMPSSPRDTKTVIAPSHLFYTITVSFCVSIPHMSPRHAQHLVQSMLISKYLRIKCTLSNHNLQPTTDRYRFIMLIIKSRRSVKLIDLPCDMIKCTV